MDSIIEKFSPLFHAIKFLACPMLIGIAIISIACLIILGNSKQSSKSEYKPLIVAFCFLGVILGVVAGGSSTPIGEALVTGVLGIITALLTYLLSKDATNIWRIFIPYTMIALLMSAFVGLIVGANYKVINRAVVENNNNDRAMRIKYYEEIMIPMCLLEKKKQLEGSSLPSNYNSQCKAIAKNLNS